MLVVSAVLVAVLVAAPTAEAIPCLFNPLATPEHCCNGVQDAGESDVDCGGACSAGAPQYQWYVASGAHMYSWAGVTVQLARDGRTSH